MKYCTYFFEIFNRCNPLYALPFGRPALCALAHQAPLGLGPSGYDQERLRQTALMRWRCLFGPGGAGWASLPARRTRGRRNPAFAALGAGSSTLFQPCGCACPACAFWSLLPPTPLPRACFEGGSMAQRCSGLVRRVARAIPDCAAPGSGAFADQSSVSVLSADEA